MPPNIQLAAQVDQPKEPKKSLSPKFFDLIVDEEPALNEQRRLCASEFLKLVQQATSTDDPSLKSAEKDKPGADSRLYKFDPKNFKNVLVFFNTNLDNRNECPILGMMKAAHFRQIYTVYKILMNPITNGVNGLCMALDVGFGRTRLALPYVCATAIIMLLWTQAKAECKTKKPEFHLPNGNKDKNVC
ncbi:hypothetical protein F5883DRAFT_650724 [Diaporthe sp. PMI_573]|nr:hypothetical protein F5883DRAFT_650724 [Diaporthaceae sp. PMI_573]